MEEKHLYMYQWVLVINHNVQLKLNPAAGGKGVKTDVRRSLTIDECFFHLYIVKAMLL